jgi:tRNA(fMet)-specific endonuclease VapC
MSRILIDTNAYCEAMRGNEAVVSQIQLVNFIGINPIVIGELLSGFKGGGRFQKNLTELNIFLDSPRVHIVPITFTTEEFYSEIYTKLKVAGTPIPTNDMWIAASALENGLKVFTSDKHFAKVDGLILY